MARYIVKRLVYMMSVFFLLTFMLFVLYQMMPANRAYTDARTEIQTMKRLSDEEKATKFDELYLKYQRIYGTDTDNKVILYLRWLGLYPFYDGHYSGIFQGDFGFSYDYNLPVIEVVPVHMRNSFLIGLITEIAVLGVTIPLGIKCAVKKNSRFDRFTRFFHTELYYLHRLYCIFLLHPGLVPGQRHEVARHQLYRVEGSAGCTPSCRTAYDLPDLRIAGRHHAPDPRDDDRRAEHGLHPDSPGQGSV